MIQVADLFQSGGRFFAKKFKSTQQDVGYLGLSLVEARSNMSFIPRPDISPVNAPNSKVFEARENGFSFFIALQEQE